MNVFPWLKTSGLALGFFFTCFVHAQNDVSDHSVDQISPALEVMDSETGVNMAESEVPLENDFSQPAVQAQSDTILANEDASQGNDNGGNQVVGAEQNSSSGIFQYLLILVVFLVLGALMYGTRNDSNVS